MNVMLKKFLGSSFQQAVQHTNDNNFNVLALDYNFAAFNLDIFRYQLEFFLNNTNLTFLAFLYKIDIGFQNQ